MNCTCKNNETCELCITVEQIIEVTKAITETEGWYEPDKRPH